MGTGPDALATGLLCVDNLTLIEHIGKLYKPQPKCSIVVNLLNIVKFFWKSKPNKINRTRSFLKNE